MKARKLPSGAWRVRTCVKGVRKSFTAPTKAEAEFMAHQYLVGQRREPTAETVGFAIRSYIDDRAAVLSPSTLGGYNSLARNAYDSINSMRLDNLDSKAVQRWVSEYSTTHAPKRTKNAYALLVASVGALRPEVHFSVRLPQARQSDAHTPTSEQVQDILTYIKGRDHDLYVACLLGAFVPMRRGEICGLLGQDVDHKAGTVTVRRNMVTDDRNVAYVKQPKSTAGYRTVALPRSIMAELPLVAPDQQVMPLAPNVVSQRFKSAARHCGLDGVHFHSLRHYGASVLHAWQIPDAFVMSRGGWSSAEIMRRVYREALDDEKRKLQSAINEKIDGLLS